jgi:hypothetical protein
VRRKPTGRGASMPSGRLRFAILAATVAAFLSVSVAQAAASGLKVNLAGSGSGTVKNNPIFTPTSPEIECTGPPASGTCESPLYEGTHNALAAIPAPGSEFAGWTIEVGSIFEEEEGESGCDGSATEKFFANIWSENFAGFEGTKGICVIEGEGGSAELTATFNSEAPTGLPLKVTHEGTGGGTIQSSPAGITCTSGSCEHNFAEGQEVTLTASPEAGSAFVAWKNCDTGGVHGRQCTVHVTPGHKVVGAKFEPANTVTVKTKGNGTGSVSGVTCGNTCTEASGVFLASKAVTLKAKPYTKTSEFKGWTASPVSCTTPEPTTCSLGLLAANETVEAEFAEIARENLKVLKAGHGQGAVKSAPAGINCSYTCGTNTAYFYKGTSVTLTASVQEGKGSTFTGWSGGGCSGTGTCTVTMSGAKEVTATFE